MYIKVVVVYFRKISWLLPGGPEENNEGAQSE
jgi:hypothetical protein